MKNTENKKSFRYLDYNLVEISKEDYENWKEDKGE